MSAPPLLDVAGLVRHFDVRRGPLRRKVGTVQAVAGVDFTVRRGETLALVGESGCGKSTVGRAIVRLIEPTAGAIRFDGVDIGALRGNALKPYRKRVQIVFQDPYSSLNPRLKAVDLIAEPLIVHRQVARRDRQAKVAALLAQVGIPADRLNNYAHEFSGGQRQRLGLARALALDPELIVADEPLSALDVSVQAQVVNLMGELQRTLGVAFVFISHDLAMVEHLSHRVAVMYLGRVVETADTATLFSVPRHPYTEALLDATPVPDPARARRDRRLVAGEVPSPINPPTGCHFHPRCPLATDLCRTDAPALRTIAPDHMVACHHR